MINTMDYWIGLIKPGLGMVIVSGFLHNLVIDI
jgi:hypothetical protein